MGRKIAVLPFEQWQSFEDELLAMQNRLCGLTCEIGKGVTLHHRSIRQLDKARLAISSARLALESPCYLATGKYPEQVCGPKRNPDVLPPNFAALCQIEPRLKELYDEANAVKDDRRAKSFCANSVWYGNFDYRGRGLKMRVCELVGWDAKHPLLRNEKSYDVAYRAIYDVLPPCRNCLCF